MSRYFVVKDAAEMDNLVTGEMIGNNRPCLMEREERKAYYESFDYPLGLKLIPSYATYYCNIFEVVDVREAGIEALKDLDEDIKYFTDKRDRLIKILEGVA